MLICLLKHTHLSNLFKNESNKWRNQKRWSCRQVYFYKSDWNRLYKLNKCCREWKVTIYRGTRFYSRKQKLHITRLIKLLNVDFCKKNARIRVTNFSCRPSGIISYALPTVKLNEFQTALCHTRIYFDACMEFVIEKDSMHSYFLNVTCVPHPRNEKHLIRKCIFL